ncbi:glycoside hydrolase/deacetylase [Aspergillus ellipticus CBS 707.79]|uniref:chitin deacetylase n=1 Tax=Aspergillus ellipticus CBS 707.79 TaxID=1448320 RepID=A0A319D3V8_9EURO|nr:glycoside hydrolase/deacetylase [Aspergillus ellipticus CBS 707.79]
MLLPLLLLILLLTPLLLIYRPPLILIRYLQHRHPDTLWHIPASSLPPGSQKTIALTIDDSPSAHTPAILSTLLENHATATFFLIGSQTPQQEPLLRDLVSNGMELANHAMRDEPSKDLSRGVLEAQIGFVDGVIERVYRDLGRERTGKWFRPGSGFYTRWMRELCRGLGYRVVLGSVYPHDAQVRWSALNAWHVESLVTGGSVVVVHDRRGWTVPMLRRLLPRLRERGFRVVSLGELVELGGRVVDGAGEGEGEGM